MTWNPNTSSERREAIRRAARAVVRLGVDPDAKEPAHRQNMIVNDPRYSDREAWDAVSALEYMLTQRGLVSAQQIETERRADALAVLMGEDVTR